MTRLDRITMQGFKSFANRITIPFPSGYNVIAGPNGSGKCLSYNSIVTLADGKNIKIGELVENKINESLCVKKLDDGFVAVGDGTRILTLNDKLKTEVRQIKAFIKRTAPEKMLQIKTRSGREITSTPYHPFFSINEKGIFSLEAKDVKIGKKIAVPRKIESPERRAAQIGTNLSAKLYVPYSDELKALIKSEIKSRKLSHKDFARNAGIPYVALKGLFDRQAIRLDYLKNISDSYELDLKIKYLRSKNQNKVFSVPAICPELARFLGYMISEGSSTNSGQLWFVNEDESLIDDFVGICSNTFSIKPGVFSYKGLTKDVIVFSKPMQLWLEGTCNLKINSKSSEKNVPEFIMSSEEPIIRNFLAALFEGDSYFNTENAYMEYATASKDLAMGLQHLLLRLNVLSNIKEKIKYASNTEKRTKRKYYSLYVYGEDLERLLNQIELKGEKKHAAEKIKMLAKKRNPNTDLVPGINLFIKGIVKECKINMKKTRKICPKLAAYYENRCECSRKGIIEIANIIKKYGTITEKSEAAIKQLLLLANSDIFFHEIIEIREAERPEWVYDLEVDETHNYIANDFFVHNSNVIDALTFVLGTTSARTIRAQKLQNLIFNGGRSRKPADFCEVSIYLDNSDKKIPIDEKEIKITRRITRSGISIYKLNGRTVTRTKILDILSQAGLSPDGYNIIMQGDVTRIIEMSPAERKEIIDDISGIAEFNEKKTRAASEMEKVEMRVRENMIVVAEKQRLVTRLKEEKENAEKYMKLEAELRKSKASLAKKRLDESNEKMDVLNREIDENTKVFDKLEKEFSTIDADLEKKEKTLLKKSEQIIEKSRNIDILRKIDSIQTEIMRKNDRIDLNAREIERLKSISVAAERNMAVKEVLNMGNSNVHGTVTSLVKIPRKYSVALEVAIGRHSSDIVVSDEDTASFCIKALKEKRIGRARFLPLTKMSMREKKPYKTKDVIGYAIDLIEFDRHYDPAIQYVLGSTLVVEHIDIAKRIRGFRVVTLDGDLVEVSGAMIGGFYKKKKGEQTYTDFSQLEDESRKLQEEIEKFEKDLEKLRGAQQEESQEVAKLQQSRTKEEEELDAMRKRRKELYEERLVLQGKISRLRIDKARLEATLDNLKIEFEDYKEITSFFSQSVEELQERVRRALIEINRLGPVNMKAVDEFKTINVEFEELKKKLDRLLEEKDAVMKVVDEIETRRYGKFMETFTGINQNFTRIYFDLTGGAAELKLEVEDNIDSGLVIMANPSGKKILNLDAMSGGEKTMASLSFLFAIMQHYASPFYVLDEIDAALDKANTKKVANVIKKYSKDVQFLVITHNDFTISEADKVFGVSMEEGVSRVFGIDMSKG